MIADNRTRVNRVAALLCALTLSHLGGARLQGVARQVQLCSDGKKLDQGQRKNRPSSYVRACACASLCVRSGTPGRASRACALAHALLRYDVRM
eukprot:6184619-Pleurochrysis_carterae.AAC.2